MKRYWKLVLLVPFIVVTISIYYQAAASGDYPSFYLKKVSGDDKEAAGVVISSGYERERMQISTAGSEYQNDGSFWKWLDSQYFYKPELDQLVKENRAFMRGKKNPSGFYIDDQLIGYAEVKSKSVLGAGGRSQSDFRLQISMYDKAQHSEASFETVLPNQGAYDFMSVDDVQMNGKVMQVLALTSKRLSGQPNSYKTDARLFTVDLDQRQVAKEEILISGERDGQTQSEIRVVNSREGTAKQSYLAFQKIVSKQSTNQDNPYEMITDHQEFLVYDLAKDETVPVENEAIQELLQGDEASRNLNISSDGERIYLMSALYGKQPRVIVYNMAKKSVEKDWVVPADLLRPNEQFSGVTRITADRLYTIVNRTMSNSPRLLILDMNAGQVVFEGAIVRRDNQDLRNMMYDDIIVK